MDNDGSPSTHDGSGAVVAERVTILVDGERVANLMSVVEVAGILGVHERTVRRRIWRGELRCVRVGDLVRVTVVDLRAYIDARRR